MTDDKFGKQSDSHKSKKNTRNADRSTDDDKFFETLDISSGSSSPRIKSDLPTSLGRYKIRGLLGEGGFGAVYLGFDEQLNRDVAIKAPHARIDVESAEQSFLQEAQRLAQLRHPGIVAIHDVGVEDGCCFIVSEYLPGNDLKDWLREQTPSWRETASIIADMADALAHAHAQSTIHRDIKPANVILVQEADGLSAKLVDFGVAISEAQESSDQRGLIAGTPGYMSPEQVRGLAHRIDGRTDIYSLGVVFYEMLCGRRPFRSRDRNELFRQIREDAPQPPRQLAHGIPLELERICLKAMAKREEQRYSTAGDFAMDLRRVLQNSEESGSMSEPLFEALEERTTSGEAAMTKASSSIRRIREAERRQLTVLICSCDAIDPNESITELDPEEQHEILEAFQHLCEPIVKRFGGTIAQSSGQELLVCFGFPTAWEDAPQRAVRTALGIMDELIHLNDALRKQKRTELAAWVAIHTGMAIASDSGTGDTTESLSIVGDARNVASRIESHSERGKIVISDATHHLIKNVFICQSQGEHTIKGVSRPVELFEVKDEIAVGSRVDLVDPANLTPLVGRDIEFGVLKDRWEHAEDGLGQVVQMIGDAGMGKSRLVREIKQYVVEINADAHIIEWRCSAYHQGSSLFPVIEFVERLLDFSRNESPVGRLDKLVAHLQQLGFDSPEHVALFASLLSLPHDARCAVLELSPIRHKEKTMLLLMEWLRTFSSIQPVLLIIEDLHWVDPSTLEFLRSQLEQGRNDRVLTLLTFRLEFHPPWHSSDNQTQVALTKLTKRQIGQMIARQSSGKEIPQAIVDRVIERTDGVPLFVEEFTQVLLQSDVLDNQSDSGTVSSALDAIPSSLQDLLVARLDRMDSDPNVVQLGATFGREFTYELLSAASDLSDDVLQAELAKLVESELLFQKGNPPSSTYSFKHALIQDAAYNSLLKKKKQQFHKSIAEVLELNFAETVETQPELVAHHYSQAQEIEKALGFWLTAGKRAQERCAVMETLSHLQNGLDLIEQLEEGPQRDQMELGFQLPMGAALLQAKGYANEDVGKTFTRARELCERLGPEAPLFHVTWGFWVWNVVLNRLETCLEFANELVRLAEQTGDDGFIMEARFCLGLSLMYVGNPTESRVQLESAFDLYDEERCRFHSQFTGQICGPILLSYLCLTLWQLGYPDQARKIGRQAVDLATQLDHPFTSGFVHYHIGWLNHYFHNGQQVKLHGEQGYTISHEGGFALWETLGVLNQGAGALLNGGLGESDAEQCMQQAQEGLTGFMATGAELHISHCYGLFADLFLRSGKLDQAATELDKGFAASEKYNEVCDLPELQRLKGELLLQTSPDNLADAQSWFNTAIQTAQTQNAKSWELRAANSLVRSSSDPQQRNQAREKLAAVYNWFTEGFDTPDLIEAKALLD